VIQLVEHPTAINRQSLTVSWVPLCSNTTQVIHTCSSFILTSHDTGWAHTADGPSLSLACLSGTLSGRAPGSGH